MLNKLFLIFFLVVTVEVSSSKASFVNGLLAGIQLTKEACDTLGPLLAKGAKGASKVSRKISHHFKKKKARRHAAKHHYVNLLRTASEEMEEDDSFSTRSYKKRVKRDTLEEDLFGLQQF